MVENLPLQAMNSPSMSKESPELAHDFGHLTLENQTVKLGNNTETTSSGGEPRGMSHVMLMVDC